MTRSTWRWFRERLGLQFAVESADVNEDVLVGSWSNVGLPMAELVADLRHLGVIVPTV